MEMDLVNDMEKVKLTLFALDGDKSEITFQAAASKSIFGVCIRVCGTNGKRVMMRLWAVLFCDHCILNDV